MSSEGSDEIRRTGSASPYEERIGFCRARLARGGGEAEATVGDA